jgi:hypothetical protein
MPTPILTMNIAEMRAEIASHIANDQLVRGKYWKGGAA